MLMGMRRILSRMFRRFFPVMMRKVVHKLQLRTKMVYGIRSGALY